MLIPFGILSAAGAGGVAFASDYELISTTILTGTQADLTFSSLGTYSSTYRHLQIRYVVNVNGGGTRHRLRVNGDTGNNYATHLLLGTGSVVNSAAAASTSQISLGSGTDGVGAWQTAVIDVLDAYSTTKNKTIRTLAGNTSGGSTEIALTSGVFLSTASITSLTVRTDTGSFITGSRFSLYGIKG